jgi:hypothetical protein
MTFAAVLASLRGVLLHTRRICNAHSRSARWLRWIRAADTGHAKPLSARRANRRTNHAAATAAQVKRLRKAARWLDDAAAQIDWVADALAAEAAERQRGGETSHGEAAANAEAVNR